MNPQELCHTHCLPTGRKPIQAGRGLRPGTQLSAWVLICLLSASLGYAAGPIGTPTPPPPPQVAPIISGDYSADTNGNCIDDSLEGGEVSIAAAEMVEVELIFNEPVTQAQINEFLRLGGQITYMYEAVSFGWFEYPDKATRDAANEQMNNSPEFVDMGQSMPFDGQRLIFGGFEAFVDERGAGDGGYVDGFVLPVPGARRDDYREMASKAAKVFIEYGASRVVEAWADDVPHGKVTDFWRSVNAEPGEQVVFSYIEWPSRAARDDAWKKVMADERMKPDMANMPFDGQRMFWGGFQRINDA